MRTCSDWWISAKSNPDMFGRPEYQTDQVENHLMACVGVNPAMLAIDLGISAIQVKATQRRLGLRKCAENNPRGTERYALDMRGHGKPRE